MSKRNVEKFSTLEVIIRKPHSKGFKTPPVPSGLRRILLVVQARQLKVRG